MAEQSYDREALARFVKNLFLNVLELPDPPQNWVEPWIDRAMVAQDPLRIFNEFIAAGANQDRLKRLEDTKTKWPSGHFYSPVVSRTEVKTHWHRLTRPYAPYGVDMREAEQTELFERLAVYFDAIPFGDEKSAKFRYYYKNPSYGFHDGLIYWAILNHFKPNKIIEIGSGFSSALAVDAIEFLQLPTTATFIDPYPEVAQSATAPLPPRHDILPMRVQDVELSIMDQLQDGDILFIDSSHVVKTGSDVQFEITQILPRLKPGVMVHFHDIFYPFEYGAPWVLDRNHSWNEIYFMHAFLMYNSTFQIMLFNDFMSRCVTEKARRLAPMQIQRFLGARPGSLWLRRA
jgi:Methyltransferase domain